MVLRSLILPSSCTNQRSTGLKGTSGEGFVHFPVLVLAYTMAGTTAKIAMQEHWESGSFSTIWYCHPKGQNKAIFHEKNKQRTNKQKKEMHFSLPSSGLWVSTKFLVLEVVWGYKLLSKFWPRGSCRVSASVTHLSQLSLSLFFRFVVVSLMMY